MFKERGDQKNREVYFHFLLGYGYNESKGAIFLQLQGGVRLFRLLTIGGSFYIASPIKGVYTEYDDRFSSQRMIVLEETRKASYHGYNFFVGFTF